MVYLEQLTSALYLDKPRDVDHYEMALWEMLEDSLIPERSCDLLRRLMRLF